MVKTLTLALLFLLIQVLSNPLVAQEKQAKNPIIYADVPDMSMIRVGDTYYMSSTTMHMTPGVPIMKSKDLVNWSLIGYASASLGNVDELTLNQGKNNYGRGSWASSLRYHKGVFYVSTFAQTTNKTYIYKTTDIEKGKWEEISFSPSLHDHSLFFDDDGKVYLITGGGRLFIYEMKDDLSGVKEETKKVLIENASAPAGNVGLPAEGSQLFKVNGKYYLFNITWPKGGMRTVVVHRADKITGPYEGKIGLQDLGVAQGGMIDTPDGTWYSYLFRDYGAVGRIPYLVPMKWVDGWPVIGIDGKVPETLDLPTNKSLIDRIVASDEFNSTDHFSMMWQWNHNPENSFWSLAKRKGFLRLTTGRTDSALLQTRNMLTQRTFGPVCSGVTSIDVSMMKDGDKAGLCLLQKKYGWVGVKCTNGKKYIVSVNAENGSESESGNIPLKQKNIFLKAECDFRNKTDKAHFFYSLDGKTWIAIGVQLNMAYTLPHFMGYRFGLFNQATQTAGGSVDFDWFRINDEIMATSKK